MTQLLQDYVGYMFRTVEEMSRLEVSPESKEYRVMNSPCSSFVSEYVRDTVIYSTFFLVIFSATKFVFKNGPLSKYYESLGDDKKNELCPYVGSS